MSISGFLKSFAVCALAAGTWCSSASAVVDGTPAPKRDRRLDAVGIFFTVAPGGGCGGWVSGSCTLIEPNAVLVARHSFDVGPGTPLPSLAERPHRVRFRRNVSGRSENNLLVNGTTCHGVYQEIEVVQLVDAPNAACDQVIAYLEHAPVGIKPIPVEMDNPPTQPTDIILAGWGYGGSCLGYATPGGTSTWALRVKRGRMPENLLGDPIVFSPCALSSSVPCQFCPPDAGPYVLANLHDSGAPILIEVPSTDPTDPTPELRLIATVSSPAVGRRPSAWNHCGGLPELTEPAQTQHLKKADFDGDGTIGALDLTGFLSAFLMGSQDASMTSSSSIGVADIYAFLGNWFNGT